MNMGRTVPVGRRFSLYSQMVEQFFGMILDMMS